MFEDVALFVLRLLEKAMHEENRSCELRSLIGNECDAIAEIWHSSASLEGVGPLVMPTLSELRARSTWRLSRAGT